MAWKLSIVIGLLGLLVWRTAPNLKIAMVMLEYPSSYVSSGAFETSCTRVMADQLSSCEDAIFWDHLDELEQLTKRFVIASCDPGRHDWNTVMGPLRNPNPRGALWLYTPEEGPQRIEFRNYPEGHDFHPLGIDVSPSRMGRLSSLYAVNHARERTVIEEFVLDPAEPARATWVRTISHPSFVSPNSIAITGPNSFYVTNDHRLTRRLPAPFGDVLPLIESLLALPGGWLAHVSLSPPSSVERWNVPTVLEHVVSVRWIPFANGVALSTDGRTLAVAATSHARVHFYTRDTSSGTLTHNATVMVPFTPDNLAFTDSGKLIVAGHPHFPSIVKLAGRKAANAPSWVVEIAPSGSGSDVASVWDADAPVSAARRVARPNGYEMRTLMQSNGTGFGSSTAGLVDEQTGMMYFVGLYEIGILACKAGP